MTQEEFDRTVESLLLKGRIVARTVDGVVQHEVTDKGRFEMAAAAWRTA